jgi:hypothetical protein
VQLALSHLWLDQRIAVLVKLGPTLNQQDIQVAMRVQEAHTKTCKDRLVVIHVLLVLLQNLRARHHVLIVESDLILMLMAHRGVNYVRHENVV